MGMNKAMVIIAVSRYMGAYGDLPGTVNSARRLQEWALQESYTVLYLGDDDETPEIAQDGITVDLLRRRIEQFLATNFIDRLVVYFAGHGAIASDVNEFWLLTNAGTDRREAIDVEALRRSLVEYNIGGSNQQARAGQLCLVGDACRVVDSDSLRLTGDSIVSKKGIARPLQVDRFLSCQQGQAAFHIDATGEAPAYCLFSDVLIDALSGNVAEAVEHDNHEFRPVVTNHRLADYLEFEVPRRAELLGEACCPTIDTQIRPPHNDYKRLQGLAPVTALPVAAGRYGPSADNRPGAEPPSRNALELAARRSQMMVAHMQFSLQMPLASRSGLERSVRPSWRRDGFVDRSRDDEALAVFCDHLPAAVAVGASSRVDTLSVAGMRAIRTSQFDGMPMLMPAGGDFLLLSSYPGVATAVLGEKPKQAVFYRPDTNEWQPGLNESGQGERRARRPLARADALATAFARDGEAFPHLAVLAGYLYEYSGRRDRVIQLAQRLARRGLDAGAGQPVLPFDLALLCADNIEWVQEGSRKVAFAALPAVEGERDGGGFKAVSPHMGWPGYSGLRGVPLWGTLPAHGSGWSLLRSADFYVPRDIRVIAEHIHGGATPRLFGKGVPVFLKAFNYRFVELGQGGGDDVLIDVPTEVLL